MPSPIKEGRYRSSTADGDKLSREVVAITHRADGALLVRVIDDGETKPAAIVFTQLDDSYWVTQMEADDGSPAAFVYGLAWRGIGDNWYLLPAIPCKGTRSIAVGAGAEIRKSGADDPAPTCHFRSRAELENGLRALVARHRPDMPMTLHLEPIPPAR